MYSYTVYAMKHAVRQLMWNSHNSMKSVHYLITVASKLVIHYLTERSIMKQCN